MPLSPPVSRKLMHTRRVVCEGYQRDDGLWDIEGQIVDVKAYSFETNQRGTVAAGTPVHDMRVRLTIDEDMVVHEAEAHTASSPFAICGDIAPDVSKLKGEKIAAGWTKRVHALLGATMGCTHINQLLTGPLATTAFQTMVPVRQARPRDPEQKPWLLDSCYAFRADGPVAKREWPKFYSGD
jgi:hypothetical protein